MTITYFDRERFVPDIPWSVQWITQHDADGDGKKDVLIPADLVEISLAVPALSPSVAESGSFTMQLKPAQAAVTTVAGTIPVNLSPVIAFTDRRLVSLAHPNFPCQSK